MKISPINNINLKYQNKPQLKKNSNVMSNDYELSSIPTYLTGFSFGAGKSLNLSQTISQIDEYSCFPPDIREMAIQEVKNGNLEDKTLIDIHKDKYFKLLDMETLLDIKMNFPEFKDVLSDSEVDYKPKSFIDDVKQGKNCYFDKDEDLTLQLLQLYWGEGFSLSDLEKEFDGRNIQGTMKKLNIPRVDRGYGLYLKLSDKEYNERFTKRMSEKLKEVARASMERKEGVYVPKGSLDEEHRKKISEGLLKYYATHPERIVEMSKRQQEFFENHPEERTKFSEVVKRAWNYREADSIKKRLSKFLGVKTVTSDVIIEALNPKSNMHSRLKEFWNKNAWASEQFSKCMTKSWKRQKELTDLGMMYEPLYEFKLFPDAMKKEIMEFANGEVPNIEKFLTCSIFDEREQEFYETEYFSEAQKTLADIEFITNDYFTQGNNGKIYSDTISFSIDIVLNDLLTDFKKLTPKQRATFNGLYKLWKERVAIPSQNHKNINIAKIGNVHSQMVDLAVYLETLEIADMFDKSMEESYKFVKEDNLQKMSERTKKLYDYFRAGF